MTFAGKALAGLVGALTLSMACALHAQNPYDSIPARNVFALRPPPPPPDPETLKPPPPTVTLTGILTIFGKKQALLKAPPGPATPARPGHPAQPPSEHSYMLAEGEAQDEIRVLRIDEVAKTVKIDAAGQVQVLTFPTNEVKTATAPAPVQRTPSGIGGGFPNQPAGGLRAIPTRSLRLPSMPAPPRRMGGA